MRLTPPALLSPSRFFPSSEDPAGRLRKAGRLALAAAGTLVALSSAAHAVVDISCQGGPGMTATQTATRWEIGFMIGEGDRANPGECILPGRGLVSGERPVLFIPLVANANLVAEAATKGGTFDLKAIEGSDGFRVTFIGQVNVVDNTPLTPGGGEAGEPGQGGEGGGMAEGGEGGGGMAVESPGCPAGTAKVSTPEGLDFLNVREEPSATATVVAQVPNQTEVTVTGACLKPAAGLTKQKVPIAAGDWCRIEAPEQGCVKAEFLVFDGGLKPAAGFAKTKSKKH